MIWRHSPHLERPSFQKIMKENKPLRALIERVQREDARMAGDPERSGGRLCLRGPGAKRLNQHDKTGGQWRKELILRGDQTTPALKLSVGGGGSERTGNEPANAP